MGSWFGSLVQPLRLRPSHQWTNKVSFQRVSFQYYSLELHYSFILSVIFLWTFSKSSFNHFIVLDRSSLVYMLFSFLFLFTVTKPFSSFNPNKQGIGEKSPTFVQNNFTPWCLKLNIFKKIRNGSQIVWPIFFNFIRTSK